MEELMREWNSLRDPMAWYVTSVKRAREAGSRVCCFQLCSDRCWLESTCQGQWLQMNKRGGEGRNCGFSSHTLISSACQLNPRHLHQGCIFRGKADEWPALSAMWPSGACSRWSVGPFFLQYSPVMKLMVELSQQLNSGSPHVTMVTRKL